MYTTVEVAMGMEDMRVHVYLLIFSIRNNTKCTGNEREKLDKLDFIKS